MDIRKHDYFSNEEIPEEERRNNAFQAVNAIRESITLAKNSSLSITYEFAFGIIHDLDKNLYDSIINLLISKNENEIVKYYKEKAEGLSSEENIINPTDLIQKELDELELILKTKKENNTYLRKRKFGLIAAKEYFNPRKQSEHKSLNHDFYLRSRDDFFGKPIYETDNFKDYQITKDKVLRLRLLHPDKDEAILGVDLIYEHFDMRLEIVRFAHMQYKTWDNNVLYASSSSNMKAQLLKMKTNICDSNYCKGSEDSRSEYRFPYCSAFLRPTSKLQANDSKLITSGYHVPLCQALILLNKEGKITKQLIKDKSIKGSIFEELFINNIAGSRWISIDDLENFYLEKGIVSNINTIRIHAQEVDTYGEYDRIKDEDRD
ncbi:hypothetical protein J3D55_001870 [Chryseobacterium ginsenosidimutans]|uniref:hypothetical protein n=1 Tax=Chryseobacterium ginsenosidimutans TaxID=687846 RepID=UPI002168AC61|nr:hypothetical protein [Chryseobacterium ginsenosidimutans]MCS3868954.1 hypothetical protein [Chryseobacterium ginsenosidimutans]